MNIQYDHPVHYSILTKLSILTKKKNVFHFFVQKHESLLLSIDIKNTSTSASGSGKQNKWLRQRLYLYKNINDLLVSELYPF